jgi:membrane protein DedA with SNARE-associated domain
MDRLHEIATSISQLIDSLAALVTDSPFTYLVIFGLAALDPILPILPAEAAVTAAAVLAGQGQLSIAAVMLAAGLGAFVGDNIAYWIGRAAGRPLVTRVVRGRTDRLEAVEEQFRRRGGTFVIVGRFIPGGRTLVSVGAGALHFPWPRFLAYDLLAVTIWAIQAALPGYLGGVLIADRPWLAMILGFGLSIALAGSIAILQRWWGRRRAVGSGDQAPGDERLMPAAAPPVLAEDEASAKPPSALIQ